MMEMVRNAVFNMVMSLYGCSSGLPEDTRWVAWGKALEVGAVAVAGMLVPGRQAGLLGSQHAWQRMCLPCNCGPQANLLLPGCLACHAGGWICLPGRELWALKRYPAAWGSATLWR